MGDLNTYVLRIKRREVSVSKATGHSISLSLSFTYLSNERPSNAYNLEKPEWSNEVLTSMQHMWNTQ